MATLYIALPVSGGFSSPVRFDSLSISCFPFFLELETSPGEKLFQRLFFLAASLRSSRSSYSIILTCNITVLLYSACTRANHCINIIIK